MIIALGSDHGGFEIKEAIKKHFDEIKQEYIDFGTHNTESIDYPPIALKVSNSIISKECDMGILCCGTGIGISIAANKVKGIRAAVCTNEFCAEMSRRHNNANILCLGGRVVSVKEAIKFANIFLNTPFEGGRHEKRIYQIMQIEDGKKEF